MKDLHGKAAVIVGGANGIGKATAIALAKRGVNVLSADIDGEAAAHAAADAQSHGYAVDWVRCDVSEADALSKLREVAIARLGQVDILMNNVGVLVCGRPEDIPLTEWERIINTNLMSVIRGVHSFMPDMIERGVGHIVNTASFAGLFPYAFDRLPYAASKAAIVTLSEGLALYLKPQGIGVTCLCPGPVRTAIGKTMKSWTPDLPLRGPGEQFEMLDADVVGEMVANAIEQDRFMLTTHPQVEELLKLRAADFDAFIQRQITGMAPLHT